MAATLRIRRVFDHLFVDRCCFSHKTVIFARSVTSGFTHLESDAVKKRHDDSNRKAVTPTLHFTKHLQTSSCLEKYYVKPNYLKKWGRRDIKRRALFKEGEMERSSLRLIKKSDILPRAVREKAASDMDQLPLNSSITRVRNRCMLTDRGRGNVGRFRVSRMMFRYFADKGLISGVTRSQW